jgi:hypothetical protein
MDREVLKQQLLQSFERTLEQMISAVEQAPDGRWIADSEWQVRQAGQDLTRDCYQAILQARIDQTPAAQQPAFSPSGAAASSLQGRQKRGAAQRRR